MAEPSSAGPGTPDRWEVGSEFHWDHGALLDAGTPTGDWLPEPHRLFASGSGALVELLRTPGAPRRLYVPSFFCMGVAEAFASTVDVRWYRELPDGAGPELEALDPAPGDAVLVVNLFGRGSREPWDAWTRTHPGVVVIEDHTHDPVSGWARASSADYCVVSLRKTLPVPDGALLWSPRGRPLPVPLPGHPGGGELKFAAMMLKAAWLAGRNVDKSVFRTLQQTGEVELHCAATAPTTATRTVLPLLDVWRLRAARADNARALLKSLPADPAGYRPLAYGPADAVPFNVQLLCDTPAVRDALVAHLAAARVYAPVHWRQAADAYHSGDPAAVDHAARILTVPVDHRYGEADVRRVADVLERFTP